ncbi:hypothetical protein MY3296_002649 [Beauveria thailandica]
MSPRTSRSNWPFVDTIYCESKCPDEDVYYSGSDDDQYENSRERKRRYELAGQRFLAGSAPRLFSASLTGPFESSQGWKNPWVSKTQARISRQPDLQIARAAKGSSSIKSRKRHIKHLGTEGGFDGSECHLPSPQSLKTASLLSEPHPYLENEELQTVQAWRHGIPASEPAVQEPTPSVTDVHPPKRKASHNWLKTVSDKRSKTEHTKDDTSKISETCTPTLPDLPIQRGELTSLGTNMQLHPSTKFPIIKRTTQLISPPKPSSAPRITIRATVPINSQPSDELSLEQQAAATLSSPVSLRNVKQEKHATQSSPLNTKARAHLLSNGASELPHVSPSKTADNHYMASIDTTSKPYRGPDDEEFVFDIALDPRSDASESEDDETSQNMQLTGGAALQEIQREPSAFFDNSSMEKDASSDSDLTELSNSPELTDEDELAEDSEAEASGVLCEMANDAFMIPAHADAEMADESECEASGTTGDAQVGQHTEADDSAEPEKNCSPDTVLKTGESTKSNEAGEALEVAVPHAAPEDEDDPSSSQEWHGFSDAEASPAPRPDAAEPEVAPNPIDRVTGVVTITPKKHVECKPRVTAETSTLSAAETAVPPSPRIKREASEFSFKAILRSLVPANPWAQRTHLASTPAQSTTQQPVSLPNMEEHVLPSVEDVPAEQHEVISMAVECDHGVGEPVTTLSTEEVCAEENNESCQQLFADQDSAPMSEKLLTSQIRGTEDALPSSCPQQSAEVEQERAVSRSEPFEYETAEGVAIADPPEEPHSPGQQATPVPSAAAYEVAPPAATPTTPPRTPSPSRSASSSEPRFAFKSFAAFSTPSPERLRVTKRRRLPGSRLRHPSLKGILVSRNADSTRRTSKAVSWLLPGDFEAEATTSSEKADGRQTDRNVPCSPPPRTPLAELPTASNEKFAKHFSSVVKRTDGLRHRFHVAADIDRVVVDSSLHTVTNSQSANLAIKNTADVAMEDVTAAVDNGDEAENRDRPREGSLSVEPMDMVEDMVREMGDFWQAWDVDAELSAAKKLQNEAATSGG